MKATDLVRLAGGFRRSAFTQRADIADYRVNSSEVLTEVKTIDIAQALAGDATADAVLKPGNIVTIRRLPGWSDIGVTVTVQGEVQYPGSYWTENGEKLSLLLKRAGGFRNKAYPQGAVLERGQVRAQEEATRLKLIQNIEATGVDLKMSPTASGHDQAAMLQAMAQQRQQIVGALRSQPASGRLVIRISPDIESWQNTSADIELRAGDVITIPKNPSFVLVSGQVYNPTALTFAPGRNADWYLHQAGGATHLANKKDIYIIRANGSVVSPGSMGSGLWKSSVLSAKLRHGDTIVVPERIIGGSSVWKAILDAAQLASNVAIAARVASSF
jgi:protein involved in polysaccharide export with SLBB domain